MESYIFSFDNDIINLDIIIHGFTTNDVDSILKSFNVYINYSNYYIFFIRI